MPEREHLADRALRDEPAAGDDRDPVAHLLHLAEQVARHEHGAALGAERADEVAELLDARGVEAVRRLVEDQQRGVLQQRRRETEPLRIPSE